MDVSSEERLGDEWSDLTSGHVDRANGRAAGKHGLHTDVGIVDTASGDFAVAWHARIAPSAVEESQIARMIEKTAERCSIASCSDWDVVG